MRVTFLLGLLYFFLDDVTRKLSKRVHTGMRTLCSLLKLFLVASRIRASETSS